MSKKLNSSILSLSKDFILNIAATLLSTGSMQLIMYPQMARKMPAEEYGTMLTVIGIINVITLAFGNNLCNSRLLDDKKYRDSNLRGDYPVLLTIMTLIASGLVLLINQYFKLDAETLGGLLVYTVLNVVCSYSLVTFRLSINYTKNLIANACLCTGYIAGSLLLLDYVSWPWVFALAYGLGVVYIWFSSDIMREPFKITPLFKKTAISAGVLLASGLIGNLTTYLDRFIIHPILGGESVSIYATAAFFAKSVNLVLIPILTVVLSYITKGKLKIDRKRYQQISLCYLLGGLVFIGVSATIGKFITGFLYPTLIASAEEYILPATCAIFAGVIGSFMGIMVLAHAPRVFQVISSSLKLVLYFVLGVTLISRFGLYGMCYGVLITNATTALLNYIVGYHYVSKKEKLTENAKT